MSLFFGLKVGNSEFPLLLAPAIKYAGAAAISEYN